MDTPILVPDGRLAIRDALRLILPSRSEAFLQGVTVSIKDFPTDDADAAAQYVPYVQVKSDGSHRDASLDTYDTIRLVFWGEDDAATTQLARLVEALILAHKDEQIRGCVSQQSVFPTYDPDNGRPMAYITFTARLRPSNLT